MKEAARIAPADLEIAREFAHKLAESYPTRISEIRMFGSRARGDADEESDLDLFVGLKGDDPQGELKAAARQLACDLTLDRGILVSVFVADRRFLEEHAEYSFLEMIEEEGVPL